MQQIADGIFQLFVPFSGPYDPVNPRRDDGLTLVYLIRQPGGWVLVDAGWDNDDSWTAIQGELAQTGVRFTDIRYLIGTHAHPDHIGLAGRVVAASGAKLVMHELDDPRYGVSRLQHYPDEQRGKARRWLEQQGVPFEVIEDLRRQRYEQRYGADGGGPRRPPTVYPPVDVVITGEGGKIDGAPDLEFVWTPGHTPGHVCVYHTKARMLCSGDHSLPRISPSVNVHPLSPPDPLGDYLKSLAKVQHLLMDLILPAHQYTIRNPKQRVEELLHHHEGRAAEVVAALRNGPLPGYGIAAQVTWRVGTWDSMGNGTRMAALGETAAHLAFLQGQGKVAMDVIDDKFIYRLKGS